MKTIKAVAEEIGVSKQAIRDKIAKLKLQSTLRKTGNSFLIPETTEITLKSAFSEVDAQSKSQSNDKANEKLIAVLEAEIAVKNKQIDTLSSALLAAQQTAAAAQALHAGTIKRLDGEEPLPDERQVANTDSEEKSKKGFMARFFRK